MASSTSTTALCVFLGEPISRDNITSSRFIQVFLKQGKDIRCTWAFSETHYQTYYQTQNIRETYLATEYIEQRQKCIWREKVVSKRAFITSENDDKTKRALFHNVKTNGEVMNGVNQVNQQVFVKHRGFYICVYPCRLQLVKSSSQSNTEPVSEQSSQHNHSHQKENNA